MPAAGWPGAAGWPAPGAELPARLLPGCAAAPGSLSRAAAHWPALSRQPARRQRPGEVQGGSVSCAAAACGCCACCLQLAAAPDLVFHSQRLLQTVPQRGVSSPELVHGRFRGALVVGVVWCRGAALHKTGACMDTEYGMDGGIQGLKSCDGPSRAAELG